MYTLHLGLVNMLLDTSRTLCGRPPTLCSPLQRFVFHHHFVVADHRLWNNKIQNHSTQDSRVVPHRGTNWAALRLTAQIGRDAVLSKSYGRGYKGRQRIHHIHRWKVWLGYIHSLYSLRRTPSPFPQSELLFAAGLQRYTHILPLSLLGLYSL